MVRETPWTILLASSSALWILILTALHLVGYLDLSWWLITAPAWCLSLSLLGRIVYIFTRNKERPGWNPSSPPSSSASSSTSSTTNRSLHEDECS